MRRQISRKIWSYANPRHHTSILMLENMAVINKIPSYREGDVNNRRVGGAGTLAPVSHAVASTVRVKKRHTIHEDTFGEDLSWHLCLVDFGR
jgi:hypothetical protein